MANIHFYFTRTDSPNFEVQNHTHRCYELVYYFSGSGYTTIEDTQYAYNANHYAIIPPLATHNDSHQQKCKLLCVGFSIGENKIPTGVFNDSNKKIRKYINILVTEFKEKRSNYLSVIQNCMHNIIIELERTNSDNNQNEDSFNELKSVIEYIDQHYCEEIEKSTLTSFVNISYDRFRHLFKHALGTSLKQYIIDKRLELAKKLLTTTNLSITDIAYQCGFPSSALFSKQFKNKTDISPSQYRNQLHSNSIMSKEQSQYNTTD